MRPAAGLTLALLALAPVDAEAAGGARSFSEGLLHPLLVPAHALAVLGLGLLIGQQAFSMRRLAIASYVAGLGTGFAALIAAVAPILAGEVLLASAAMSGALVALARPLPLPAGCVLATIAGAALAFDSSPGGISIPQANVALTGTFFGAVFLLLAVVISSGPLRGERWRIGARIAGSWVSASAMMVLALTLAH
ncbi:MAG: HupE/UreJ family protein [Hyphomicrobiaceae bacterium]